MADLCGYPSLIKAHGGRYEVLSFNTEIVGFTSAQRSGGSLGKWGWQENNGSQLLGYAVGRADSWYLKKTLSDCLVEVSKDNSLEGSETEKREDQVGAPWSSKQGLNSLLLVKDITTANLSA